MVQKAYYKNPDFQEVFVFIEEEVKTSDEKFRHIRSDIYRKVNKPNTDKFIRQIKEKLTSKRKKRWPYKNNLMFYLGINGIKKLYAKKDLDNMAKAVLDSFKGIVIEDDSQVQILIVSKWIFDENLKGFTVGIRLLEGKKIDKYLPVLYSGDPNRWLNERMTTPSQSMKEDYGFFEVYS